MLPSYDGVVIDDEHARELDDSVWVDQTDWGWRVTVCVADVADVAGAVPRGSEVDDLALASGGTLYMHMRAARRMLPAQVSSRLTLLPGEPRRVIAYVVSLDESLEVLACEPALGLLCHRGLLSYEQAGAAMLAGEAFSSVQAMLLAALELCEALCEKRADANPRTFRPHEERIRRRPGPEMLASRGRLVVRELMILLTSSPP